MDYKIGDEVTIKISGKVVSISGDYEDKLLRYTIEGFPHCTRAIVMLEHITQQEFCCDSCGREFGLNETYEIPQEDGADDIDLVPACKECHDRALTHSPE